MVCVCDHCHSLIARAESDVENLGKVPDLVAIDTRLALGDTGRLQELTFQVLGRLQLHQGAASWNEWYVAWSDGSFGWLAEAAGRVIVSRRVERQLKLPPYGRLRPGQRLALEGVGELVIEEIGDARVISAQGELPFLPQLEHAYRFADGSLSGGLYATLEYDDAGDPSDVFVGRELSYEAAGLQSAGAERAWQAPQTSGRALRCPSCGGPISLKLATSVSVVCPHCDKLFSHEQGELSLVTGLKRRHQPALALGATGELLGHKSEVIGWTRRAVTVSGTDYRWDEYLLHGANGYAFLSENQGHWVYFTLLPAAAVSVVGRHAFYETERYEHFQRSNDVRYVDVQGEFYWQLRPSDRVDMDDYVRPPYQLSVEHAPNEQTWSRGEYVPAEQVWKSFGQSASPPAQKGAGPCQPNPHAKALRDVLIGFGIGLSLMVLFTVALSIAQPRRVRLVHHVPLADEQAVSLSDPFKINGGVQAVAIEGYAAFAGDGWVALDISLIEEQTGKSAEVDMELSYFSGYSDGEHWSEDTRSAEKRVGSVAPGRYLLRVEPHFDPAYARPSFVRIEVAQGAYLWLPLVLCMLALGLPPLVLWIMKASFEARRWSESDHAGGGD